MPLKALPCLLQKPYTIDPPIPESEQPEKLAEIFADCKNLKPKVTFSQEKILALVNEIKSRDGDLMDIAGFLDDGVKRALSQIAETYISHQTGFYSPDFICNSPQEAELLMDDGLNMLKQVMDEKDLKKLFSNLTLQMDEIIEARLDTQRPAHQARRF